MRIAFLLFRHPPGRVSPIMPEVVRRLARRGAQVTAIHPEEQVSDLGALRVEHDLYVLKSGSEVALSVAGALDALGASILNSHAVSTRCRDKIVATRILQSAGVPVPDTYVAQDPVELAWALERGPLVVKPYRGSQGRGVRVVREPAELAGDGPVIAQRYHPPDGRDHKLYCIGGEIFGVRRVWPVRSYRDKLGEPFAVAPEIRDIALRCGRAFGIDLYGLDVIFSGGTPYVVDISSFPGFKGVPDAAARLADHLYAAARRVS
jgi:ribosomal protein S6--L-glutamate ligase